ncbi:MAG: response regulator, partial [Caldilineae bacterium]
VVEDNPDARGAFVDILRDLGYQVLEAGDGEEALALYTAHRDEIDLVLSDMVMPRMGGLALYQALRQQNPHVKLAIVSGYPLGAAEESNSETGILAWLSKPFDMVTLSRHLRAMLEEEPLLQK